MKDERLLASASSPASPVGMHIVKWTARRHRKAIWTFYNGVGD